MKKLLIILALMEKSVQIDPAGKCDPFRRNKIDPRRRNKNDPCRNTPQGIFL